MSALDRKLIVPGTMIAWKGFPSSIWVVVAVNEIVYPGPWQEVVVMLLGEDRLITWTWEIEDFSRKWQVIHAT